MLCVGRDRKDAALREEIRDKMMMLGRQIRNGELNERYREEMER